MKIRAPRLQSSPFTRIEFVKTLTLGFLCAGSFACSTLVGNVKPVDEKSDRYEILDLSRDSRLWLKLDPRSLGNSDAVDPKSDAYSSEVSDVTYQSKKTAAVVSLNSACRQGRDEAVDLETFARELTLGISEAGEPEQKEIQVSGKPALQTTLEGTLAGQRTKIRTVVVQNRTCIYDLMYVSRPDKFSVHEADFTRFVSSLKLR